jgi:hypothetical protein
MTMALFGSILGQVLLAGLHQSQLEQIEAAS